MPAPVLFFYNQRMSGKNEKKKVLIVEDSKMSKHVLQVSVERLGFIPIIASDGQEALQLLEENKDLVIVLSDLKMPNLDGFELLQEVRKQESFKKLPFIIITSDKDRCDEARKLGANGYLPKPATWDKIKALFYILFPDYVKESE